MRIAAVQPTPHLLPHAQQPAPPSAQQLVGRRSADAEASISAEARRRLGEEERAGSGSRSRNLSEAEQEQVRELEARDAEVRAHEQAHMSAAGGLAQGGPSYTYQRGPDGRRYAVGGEVQIDTSPGRSAEESMQKGRRIVAAALAPQEPSPQDHQVAAQGRKMVLDAQAELAAAETAPTPRGEGDPQPSASQISSLGAAAPDIGLLLQQRGLPI